MSKSFNRAFLLGWVGRAPRFASTAAGALAANFTMATRHRQRDHQGNWTEKTEWHYLVAYARCAEIIRDCVGKGSRLFVEGRMQTRSWEDRQAGVRRYRTEILIDELTLLSDRSGAAGRGAGAASGPARGLFEDARREDGPGQREQGGRR